jgi:hypothetical protein
VTPISILEAFASRKVFGLLPKLKDIGTWRAWIVVLKAIFGLPFDKEDQRIFKQCTNRNSPPTGGARETYIIVGRRGGKSFIAAIIAVFMACFVNFKKYATVGESLVVLCLAKDIPQARVVFKYVRDILHFIPMLKAMIAAERADEIELSSGVSIVVKASDYASLRGYTVCCLIADEVGFWASQGANSDDEIIRSIRPGMLSIPDGKMIFISTPYAQFGALFEAHRKYFGKEDKRFLVWQAPSIRMNPTLSQIKIDEQLEEDP